MEVAQMIAIHSILVKVFLGFLVLGFFIPLMVKKATGFKKASFIFTMIFQALITMIAFSGLVAVLTGDLPWTVSTIIMVALWAVMMYIEIKKHKLVKVANLENADTFKVIKGAFLKINILQILLVAIMVVMMILKAKGVISL